MYGLWTTEQNWTTNIETFKKLVFLRFQRFVYGYFHLVYHCLILIGWFIKICFENLKTYQKFVVLWLDLFLQVIPFPNFYPCFLSCLMLMMIVNYYLFRNFVFTLFLEVFRFLLVFLSFFTCFLLSILHFLFLCGFIQFLVLFNLIARSTFYFDF